MSDRSSPDHDRHHDCRTGRGAAGGGVAGRFARPAVVGCLLILFLLLGCGDPGVRQPASLGGTDGIVFLEVDTEGGRGFLAPGELRLAFTAASDRWIGTAAFRVAQDCTLYVLQMPAGRYRLGQVWVDGLTNLLLSDGVYSDFTVAAGRLNYAGRFVLRRADGTTARAARRPFVLVFEPSRASFEAASAWFRGQYPDLSARYPFGAAFPLEAPQDTPTGPLALGPTGG